MIDIELEKIVNTNYFIKNMRIYSGIFKKKCRNILTFLREYGIEIFHEKYGNIVPSLLITRERRNS